MLNPITTVQQLCFEPTYQGAQFNFRGAIPCVAQGIFDSPGIFQFANRDKCILWDKQQNQRWHQWYRLHIELSNTWQRWIHIYGKYASINHRLKVMIFKHLYAFLLSYSPDERHFLKPIVEYKLKGFAIILIVGSWLDIPLYSLPPFRRLASALDLFSFSTRENGTRPLVAM